MHDDPATVCLPEHFDIYKALATATWFLPVLPWQWLEEDYMHRSVWVELVKCGNIGEAIALTKAFQEKYPYTVRKDYRAKVVREIPGIEFQNEGIVVRMRGVTSEPEWYRWMMVAEGFLLGYRAERVG